MNALKHLIASFIFCLKPKNGTHVDIRSYSMGLSNAQGTSLLLSISLLCDGIEKDSGESDRIPSIGSLFNRSLLTVYDKTVFLQFTLDLVVCFVLQGSRVGLMLRGD